jgi:hypothetical protein
MIEVLKQMVEALEWCHGGEPVGTAEAIQAGKQLIAELESQEPVAWLLTGNAPLFDGEIIVHMSKPKWIPEWWRAEPLYTHPPQRKPLTDEQILNVARDHYNPHQRPEISFARAIEASHGIKE